MSFFIRATTRRLIAPHHELSCALWTWRRLIAALRERGRHTRESGAFLLGHRDSEGRAHIEDFVLYDDLDPNSLESGIIRFDGRHFGALWERCRRTKMAVVADVHTHPGPCDQSPSDRAHPMIAQPNHISLIIPRFARGLCNASVVGIYQYLGHQRWRTIASDERSRTFHIGI